MEKLPFIPDQVYNRRRDIHALYGGNWQGGICPSSKFPYIFIFSGKTGHQHGYQDRWDNPDIFSYTGEGQSGDMSFTRGNLALRDHLNNGQRVFLFDFVSKGFVRFVSEVVCFDFDFFETLDTRGQKRNGIRFFFKRAGASLFIDPELTRHPDLIKDPVRIISSDIPGITEREGLITSRVGQGAYRKSIIHRWQYKCAVTGYNKIDLLIASHIVPWANATDHERLDVDNGILLSPTYDALFDRHLISFENSGKIIFSDKIEIQSLARIGVSGKEIIKDISSNNKKYLERHRTQMAKSG